MNNMSRLPEIPPEDADDEEFREFGRQLALDELMTMAARQDRAEKIASPMRWKTFAAAAAAVLLVGWLIQLMTQTATPAPTARWAVTPSGGASYEFVSDNRIRLNHGELSLVPPTDASPITIETSTGVARSDGAAFLIGSHHLTQNNQSPTIEPESTMINYPITRILVLAGAVSLTAMSETVTAGPSELIVAEQDKKPDKEAVQANSTFATKLYQKLAEAQPGENLFFSPYSISSALTMLAEGARGETAREMGEILGFPATTRRDGEDSQRIPWETAKLHAGISGINALLEEWNTPEAKAQRAESEKIFAELDELISEAKQYEKAGDQEALDKLEAKAEEISKRQKELQSSLHPELNIANAMWVDQAFPLIPVYAKTINQAYALGGVLEADFRNSAEAEREHINAWVGKSTRGKIPSILPPRSVNSLTSLVLANAIYFRGNWETPFKKGSTRLRRFHLADGETKEIPMMRHWPLLGGRFAEFRADGSFYDTPATYHSDEKRPSSGEGGFAMMELPYKNNSLAMVLIAPNQHDGLANVEKKFAAGSLDAWLSKLRSRETRVTMPKLKLTTSYDLNGTLQALGMKKVFSDAADLSGISQGSPELYVRGLFHRATLEVDEAGSIAVAATAALGAEKSERKKVIKHTPHFRADKPHLVLIRDKRSGVILFLGRISNPEAG